MRVEVLKPWHLHALEKQGVKEVVPVFKYMNSLLVPPSFAGVVDKGIVCAMGLVEQVPGNWRCWAITDPVLAKRHFFGLNKAMRAFLTEFRKPRIETIVIVGNVAGHRWCTEIHGFQAEGIMRKYINGQDAMLYSKVI